MTVGLPFARGVLQGNESVSLVQDETTGPAQVEVLDRWSDGSVRWLLVHTRVSTPSQRLEFIFPHLADESKAAPRDRLDELLELATVSKRAARGIDAIAER